MLKLWGGGNSLVQRCLPPVYVPACVMFFASLTCRYVLLVSGLNLGSSHSNEFIEMMVDYITGQLDGAEVGTSYYEIDHF